MALLWNILGVISYLVRAFATEGIIDALPEEQQAEFLSEYPAWYTAVFALAVFCGGLGCIALLLRKKWAKPLFLISALSAIAQHVYLFQNKDINGVALIMPIMVIVVCLLLIWLSNHAISKGWIN